MESSILVKQARALIEENRGKILSIGERINKAIRVASLIMEEANRIQTPKEKASQAQLARMMNNPIGKIFTTAITDQCFRSKKNDRIANQLNFVVKKYGIPKFLSLDKKIGFIIFRLFGEYFASFMVPKTIQLIRKETSAVILPGEEEDLKKHMEQRRIEGVRINLNHLGEAILGETEALSRLNVYLKDLSKQEVECISIKISTIYSQINLLDWQGTLDTVAERLRLLFRTALKSKFRLKDGLLKSKFVNLDMEEYKDLSMTVEVFMKVLSEPEFYNFSAGIVLQSYLPDSFVIQKKLTEWAKERVLNGGAPIKIRIVKGANLAMERVEAALKIWPQAPYVTKADVDANYKKMVSYGCQKDNARACQIGIASHNLFDIAYGLLLRSENQVEKDVCFEMLEGMADHIRRVVQQLSNDMLLYCPAATKEEFQNAVAYLVRRLDENTAPENFLRHAFNLKPDSPQWKWQSDLFKTSCLLAESAPIYSNRKQNRQNEYFLENKSFQNEPDTDWSLLQNRQWAETIINDWKEKKIETIPLVINGQTLYSDGLNLGKGMDPSRPKITLFEYTLASKDQIEKALTASKKAEENWSFNSIQERFLLLGKIAQGLRQNRDILIGAMVANTGKTVPEADIEVSEAIDFAEYYRFNLIEWHSFDDIKWKPKGTILVTPPWNFPCSIPAGGILAALATGNTVIFKPAAESILVGWVLAQIFWEAGVNKEVLQFITCEDDPIGSLLIKDPRISAVILTGSTETAKLFLQMRPGLPLFAETGGKNTMVISAMSDRDLAVKDLVQSAFGHSGQKCSACSLAILEAEVYDDLHFRRQLVDAVSSLTVGSAWDFKTKINPLIRIPGQILQKGLTELEDGEDWLLKPLQDPDNPNLWSPGIKLNVKPNHFTFQNELFGPVLGLVRATHLEHAFQMMNQTPYGLTAGIHSLDEREQQAWLKRIEAGNCYINRTITGAIVQRQPFGGCKESSFGKGAKAGGPNYLTQFMHAEQISFPKEETEIDSIFADLNQKIVNQKILGHSYKLWETSIKSYSYYWKQYFSKEHDPSLVLGQDNFQKYIPYQKITLIIQDHDSFIDIIRVIAAAMLCKVSLEISGNYHAMNQLKKLPLPAIISKIVETEEQVIERINQKTIKRIRMLSQPSQELQHALSFAACNVHLDPVLANGRLELLNYLREVSISHDYHRYGNLGDRENEKRTPIVNDQLNNKAVSCEACGTDE